MVELLTVKCSWKSLNRRGLVRLMAATVCCLLLMTSLRAEARRIERLRLEPVTMAEMSALLGQGDALHGALTKQDDEQTEVVLRDLQIAIAKTVQASSKLKIHERSHLLKILDSMGENLEIARNSGSDERRERLAEVFNMLANLVRIYAVEPRFKIFFCSRDKMTWVQTKPRGVYPFPEMGERDCALRAP